MKVLVLFFAGLAEAAGSRSIEINLPESARARDAMDECLRRVSALAPALKGTVLAVNDAYADPDQPLNPGDVVALIPPVSGG